MSQYTSETVHHSILWRRSYQPTKYFFFHPSIFTICIYTAESSKVFVVEQLCLGSASITQFLMRTGLNMLFCNKKCTMVQINLQPNYSTAIVYFPYFFSVETSIQEGTSIHQNMYMWRRHWSTLNPPILCCIWAFNTALKRTWLTERSPFQAAAFACCLIWCKPRYCKILPSHPQSPNWVQAQSHPPNLLLWHLL